FLIQSVATVKENGQFRGIRSMAARNVSINGQIVDLQAIRWSLISQNDSTGAVFQVTIADDAGSPVVSITRTYTLAQDSYELSCVHEFHNLTDAPLRVVFSQNGPMEVPHDSGFTEYRDFFAGYYDLGHDPN